MRKLLISLLCVWALWEILGSLQGRPGRHTLNVLTSADIAANVFFLGGDPEETLSSRFGKWLTNPNDAERDVVARKRIARLLCETWWMDLLNLEREHCRKSVNPREGDEGVGR